MKFRKPQNWIQILLVAAPLAMVVARRSSTLLLAATAFITLIQDRKTATANWRSARMDPYLILGIGLLIGWAALSLLWSPLPTRGLKQLAFDFALPVMCGLWLFTLPNQPPSQRSALWFVIGLGLAALLVSLQFHFEFRLEALFNPKEKHTEAWRFNMVVVSYALFVPTLLLLMRRIPFAAAFALLAIVAASILSQSATSKAALMVSVLTFAVARVLPRQISLGLFGLTLFGILALQPWQGRLVDQTLQVTSQTERLFQSAKERIVIWQATGSVTLDALPWGTGMGSSDAVSETPFAKTLPQDLWVGLRQTHAHNAFLNVWMELGIPGLIGMMLIAFGVLRILARIPDALYAPAMALAAQIIVVDLISHGAWQAWWFTAIMLGILALKQYAPPIDQKS